MAELTRLSKCINRMAVLLLLYRTNMYYGTLL